MNLFSTISDGQGANGYLHPFWIIMIVAVSSVPAMFVLFLFYCGLNDYKFYLPFRVRRTTRIGPFRCPQCGLQLLDKTMIVFVVFAFFF